MTLGEYFSNILDKDGKPIDVSKIETIAGYQIGEAIEILIRHRNKWYEDIDRKLADRFNEGFSVGYETCKRKVGWFEEKEE